MIRAVGFAAVAAVAGLLGGCMSAPAPGGSEPVDARYSATGGSYNTGGSLIVMLRAREQDGRVAICGAKTRTRESAVSLPYGFSVEGAGVVQLAGVNIFQGVRRFPEYPLANDMTGVSAVCLVSERQWEPRFDGAVPVARFARMPFGLDDYGQVDTVFRGGPVPDVIARP
ncbi:hypothetical protein H0I76_19185 [Limibaculum sp. M0105]|uniref:Lipoprotein n=1 Tax=Thermohalobaculum xanthum TaxID=2753746 RepID=A0A8J7SID7_9RHOB|nr:hypothetical protein [Thermohalobaculum xanthum]MBK0401322.1 hypothetical protein [Thermohalobaculum xanthum]